MLKKLSKYAGAIFLYVAIVVMILLANARFSNLDQEKSATETATQAAHETQLIKKINY